MGKTNEIPSFPSALPHRDIRRWGLWAMMCCILAAFFILFADDGSSSSKAILSSDAKTNLYPSQQQQQDYKAYLPIVITNTMAGPLRVDPANPRYFTNDTGRAILLAGSHTWAVFQDIELVDPPTPFDYDGWLDFLEANGHNFFHMWAWENARWMAAVSDDVYLAPSAYKRTGPGTALDGKPKFDLTQFNQEYFDRLRQRVITARDRGFYVSINMFNGFSVGTKGDYPGNPWQGHPYNAHNNINSIDGDPDHDGSGKEIEHLSIPSITALQEAYVRKVIDTVNDLDNVLYEIAKETDNGAEVGWQNHFIDYIHAYEAGKPKQHPVGFTAMWPDGDNTYLFASNADWISPLDQSNYYANDDYKNDPPVADGSKVILLDTDHLWGSLGGNRFWAWKAFCRGYNPIFMDAYNSPFSTDYPDLDQSPDAVSLRRNLGYILAYSKRMNLAAPTPRPDLCSTGYCLATEGTEYLVYLPRGGSVTVNLSAASGQLSVEWLNPSTGTTSAGGTTTGGASHSFTAPFSGDAVLYISEF
jgi:hypothetical protein